MNNSKKIFLIKELKQHIKNNNLPAIYQNSSIFEFQLDYFKDKVIGDFSKKELISESKIKEMGNKYLKKEFESISRIPIRQEDAQLFSDTLGKIYGEINSPDIASEISLGELMHVFMNKLIMSHIYRYYAENLKEDYLLTSSNSRRELQEFEIMNNYRYLSSFFKFLSPLTSSILDLELNAFIQDIESADNPSEIMLLRTRRFYNIMIKFISAFSTDFKLFRIGLRNERFIIKKSEITKYNFYESLDELKFVMDEEMIKFDELKNQVRGHKKEIEELIRNKEFNRDKIISRLMWLTEMIKTSMSG